MENYFLKTVKDGYCIFTTSIPGQSFSFKKGALKSGLSFAHNSRESIEDLEKMVFIPFVEWVSEKYPELI
ncbi:hypothetical protein [Arcticibacterium luteifluviistationis]|uniref:Uncharacterized protein n=1 Tax=Arcticibacterium luteifluviistationis TaxID=1784714 RepID=A0A2Z4GBZ8_9BACT|nr:hypothetical protein [Arcticibacterium luteifluviistationis]AWV98575.1 hypothetical protein DJ013_10500 [Arcticibacterium luteifluviistationis]